MNSKNLLKNDNAVSISIGFILMFAVTVIMFTAVILSFYTLSQNLEKSAMQESFKVIGSGLAVKITTIDMLVNKTNFYDGGVNTLEYEFSMPASIAGKTYTVNISNSTYSKITLEADNGAKVVIPFNISTNFTGRKIYSGAENYKLYYNITSKNIDIDEQ